MNEWRQRFIEQLWPGCDACFDPACFGDGECPGLAAFQRAGRDDLRAGPRTRHATLEEQIYRFKQDGAAITTVRFYWTTVAGIRCPAWAYR